jgi:hypothetical protein
VSSWRQENSFVFAERENSINRCIYTGGHTVTGQIRRSKARSKILQYQSAVDHNNDILIIECYSSEARKIFTQIKDQFQDKSMI